MAQRFKPDVIGALSHNAGTITLAASRLTIGGQQYSTSALQLILPALTANATYMLYVVVSAGVASLIQSTNVNSVGPAGQTSWKLVGAYMASDVAAFGSFINLKGTPRTQTALTYLPGSTGFGILSGQAFSYTRDGKFLVGDFRWATGTVVGSTARIAFPNNLAADTAYLASTTHILGTCLNNSSVNFTNAVIITSDSLNNILFNSNNSLSATGLLGNTSPFASGQLQSCQVRIPISAWSNIPIEDL